MSNFLKSTIIRDAAISALSRMTVMAPTVWRNAGGSFRGEAGDVITIRIPAYTEANTRMLRSTSPRSRRGLFESRVQVTLNEGIYRDVPLSDEEQTLDIMNFASQVMNPMLSGVARGIDNELITTVTGATYQHEVAVASGSPLDAIVDARAALNNSNVDDDGFRYLALGSAVEAAFLKADLLQQVNTSGNSDTLRRGVIGDLYGFTVISVPGLPPDEAYAYHRTAYALAIQAPVVPSSFTGFTASADNFAIRLVQVPDPELIQNIVSAETYVGASEVKDVGTIDDDGVFTPAEDPDDSGVSSLFVRAVKLELTS